MATDTTPRFYKVLLEIMEIWIFDCFHGNSPWGKSTGSVEEVNFLPMFLSRLHGVRCALPPPAPRNISQLLRKIGCRTKPITCIWPLPFLCRDESGNTVWLCQPLGFQRESEGQVPSTLKFPSQLGGVAGDWRKGRIPSRKPSPIQTSTVSN